MNADFYMLHLTGGDIGHEDAGKCSYYMWKQSFHVKQENKVDVRSEVDEWAITLAFPIGKRLKRCATFPGIYSFLPTETVTNFPFIIQADFLLASSRENILWDNKWNQGILDCVPIAFVNAFISLVRSENVAASSLPVIFQYLPVHRSSHPKLNHVRNVIKTKLMNKAIVPCESHPVQIFFRKPNEVYRLKPEFSDILNKASNEGVALHNISSHGANLIAFSFDNEDYDAILDFLGIRYVGYQWYTKFIADSDLVMGVSEDVYVELLVFLVEDWDSLFHNTNIKNIPIIKYVGLDGNVELIHINAVSRSYSTIKLLAAGSSGNASWLVNWNNEFGRATGQFFLPRATQQAIRSCSEQYMLENWLKYNVKVRFVSVYGYARHVGLSLNHDPQLAVTYAHFLCNSLKKNYLHQHEVENLCRDMPIVDERGRVTADWNKVLVPANGSKWRELIGINLWGYVELGEDYTRDARYFYNFTSGEELVCFLEAYIGASDIPNLSPPNVAIPTLSSPLSKRNTLLLLEWLCNLRESEVDLSERFLSCIKSGSWLRVSLSGGPGYKPASESFMLDTSVGHVLQNGQVLVDIPLVDEKFYGDVRKQYKEELGMIGVRFENKDACEYIGKRLMSLANSSKLTRDDVFSILKFIRYLVANHLSGSCIEFIKCIRGGKWLRTSRGDMTPTNSVLFSSDWNTASQISDIPFIDQDYYGKELLSFKEELSILGVAVNFTQNRYQLVSDNLKSSSSFKSLSSDAILLILSCIQKLNSSDKLVQALQHTKCLRTNLGDRYPSECFLVNSECDWGCLLRVFGSFPVLDEKFYGNTIFSMSKELKKIGVMVDFEDAIKEFTRTFKQQALSHSITKEQVFSFLSCYRRLKTKLVFNLEFNNCIRKENWIRTRVFGSYRSPNECILFGTEWEPISSISVLSFIDDSSHFYGRGIHAYKEELKLLGVTTDFKDGANFVAAGLFLPHDPSIITPVTVYALLDSLKKLDKIQPDIRAKFLSQPSHNKWLKTMFGYKRPNECLLFNSAWDSFLKRSDGPFIDEGFYGCRIGFYKEELKVLGVVTDINNMSHLVAACLNLHTNFPTISRIYNYLYYFKWEPAVGDSRKIWIPRGTDNGQWVDPDDCVLHDKDNLFVGQLNVLEKFKYEKKLLNFFAISLNVKVHPSVDDYCNLWKKWEASGNQISHADCCAFWQFVVKNWTSKTEETFNKNLSKLPVLDPASGGILLVSKCDVFIGDDLFLMDLFHSSSRSRPICVWYPQPTVNFLTRNKLENIYTKLGVRTLSESTQKNISYADHSQSIPVNPREKIITKGLFKLILGFLADPCLKLDTERRHEAVSRLLAVEAFETSEPPSTVGHTLSLSSGDLLNVEENKMIYWDKKNSKLFMKKMEKSCGFKAVMEYAFHVGEVIAEGVLGENVEVVPQLSELTRLGFLVMFDDNAIDFLMKTKNLQIFMEDQQYLSSTFSS